MVDEKYISAIAHELKNPISVISSQIELLEAECIENINESRKKKIDILKRNIKKANYIINELLNLALIENGKIEIELQETSIKELVNDLQISCQDFANQKKIKLNFQYSENLSFYADFIKLAQSVTNLILNAIHFSYEGSEVDVIFVREDPIFKIEVKDKGIGIRRENHESIFHPFFQENNGKDSKGIKRKGLGLGLFVSRKMIEMHGGRIDVYSELGYGATFVVVIPLQIPKIAGPENER